MRKFFSILAIILIFFSLGGEAVGAAFCECSETSIDHPVSVERASIIHYAVAPPDSADAVFHDCHFGHCGFTVNLSANLCFSLDPRETSVPTGFATPPALHLAETLRPPAHA